MKTKCIFLIVAGIMFAPVWLNAQVYEGEAPAEEEAQPTTGSQKYKDGFLHITYLGMTMEPDNIYDEGPFRPGTETKGGFMIETGGYRFFGDNFLFNNLANIGLYSSFGFGIELYDFDLDDDFEGSKLPFLFSDFKLGPDFRFEASHNVKFDLYGNIGLLAGYGGYVESDDGGIFYEPTNLALAYQSGFGLDVHLSNFVIGAQLTFSKSTFNYIITEENEFLVDVNEAEKEYDVSLDSFRFHIGYSFSK